MIHRGCLLMSRCTIFVAGLLWMASVLCSCGERPSAALRRGFDTRSRKEWVKRATAYLSSFKPSRRTPRATVDSVGGRDWIVAKHYGTADGWIEYDVRKEGLIDLDDGGWVYIITHSSHENITLGDFVLAVDHTGAIYRVDTHPCPMIFVTPPNGKSFRSAEEFFASPVLDVDPIRWEKIK